MNSDNDGNVLGRVTALAVILGAAYGVHALGRGGLGCPLGSGSCCAMPASQAAPAAAPSASAAPAPAK